MTTTTPRVEGLWSETPTLQSYGLKRQLYASHVLYQSISDNSSPGITPATSLVSLRFVVVYCDGAVNSVV